MPRRVAPAPRNRCRTAALTIACLVAAALTTAGAAVPAAAVGEAPPALCPPTPGAVPVPAPVPLPAPGGIPHDGAGVPAPEQLIACIGAIPLVGATYSHWLSIVERAGEPAAEAPASALTFLIVSDWLKGEATRDHVHLTAVTVKRTFDRIRAQQFPHRREFDSFLRRSGQTIADILFRVELNLLSTRLIERAVRGQRTAAGRRRALSRFVAGLQRRWQAMTYCSPQFAVADCGHVQEAL